MTDLRWLAPAEAVAASARGEIMLRNPTVKNLMRFDGARTVAEALDQVRDRPVPTILPRIVVDADGTRRALLPGDRGYDEAGLRGWGARTAILVGWGVP
jgi:hypothetical protein